MHMPLNASAPCCTVRQKEQPGLTNLLFTHSQRTEMTHNMAKQRKVMVSNREARFAADLLEYSLYYSIREGVVAISDEVLLADQEVMVIIQFPKLQGQQKFGSTSEQAIGCNTCRFLLLLNRLKS